MRKMIMLFCFGILFPCIGQAALNSALYCKLVQEADSNGEILPLYITQDELGNPQVHLEGPAYEEDDIPGIMEKLESGEMFGTATLIGTRPRPKREDDFMAPTLFFHVKAALEVNERIALSPKDGMKDVETGEMRWKWKETICEDGVPVDVNRKDQDGQPYLLQVIRSRPDKVPAILRAGADPNSNESNWGTPLCQAATMCQTETVEALLKAGARVNEHTVGHNALACSAMTGFQVERCVQTAEVLIKAGATAKNYCDVLLFATNTPQSDPRAPQLLEKVIATGADVNCRSQITGATPLINASSLGHALLVKTLLAKGAYPNIKMNDGATALKIAMENGDQEIIKLLKASGAK